MPDANAGCLTLDCLREFFLLIGEFILCVLLSLVLANDSGSREDSFCRQSLRPLDRNLHGSLAREAALFGLLTIGPDSVLRTY